MARKTIEKSKVYELLNKKIKLIELLAEINEETYKKRGSNTDLGAYVAYTIAAQELKDILERIENDNA